MTRLTVIKVQLVLWAVCVWASQGVYYRRTGALHRVRGPAAPPPAAAFRPGVSLQQRPYHRLVQAASHRAPYILYRSPPQHRYAVKHFGPSTTRNVFAAGPWKSTTPARLSPLPGLTGAGAGGGGGGGLAGPGLTPAAEYEFLRAASAPPLVQNNGGAIHTVPAPDLSLSEKPIVVAEAAGSLPGHNDAAEQVKYHDYIYKMRTNQPKPSYEVTEKYVEPVYQMAKIETPIGFSKTQSMQSQSSPDLQAYLRNGAALQIASDYGLAAISVPHRPVSHGVVVPQPQQYTLQGLQGFSAVPSQHDLISTGADSVMIPPNVLYQSDPLFLQKLQQQLLQRFPALEFVPYAPELMPQNPQNEATQAQQLFLLENEEIKQPPEPFLSSESKNVFQRETQESSLVTLRPQAFVVSNVTENMEPSTTQQPHNITLELIAGESQPVTTTIKYVIESNTEPLTIRTTEPQSTQNTTPIYYAQVGQSVGDVIANGFYSAMNDVRAAAAMEQALENAPQTTKAPDNVTTENPIKADLKQYFVQNEINENQTVAELKPLLGVPFAKPADSVKVAYTLLRTEEKEPKSREGVVYAGQIVEASISEDHEFNNKKATLMKRAPIRLYVSDKETSQPLLASSTPKVTLVKAKIPPKSKLTFDDKTGEPVLRIYASYVDSPTQRQAVTTKLSTLASVKPVSRKASIDTGDSWKATTVKSADKSQGFDGNQVTKFGLKLRSRSDDYIPLFEEYDD